MAALLSAVLEDEGYSVARVASLDEAVALFVARGPRAARLVLGPSSMEPPAWANGWLAALRDRTDAAIVARVSSRSTNEDADHARFGVSALLREPYMPDDLVNIVASLHAAPIPTGMRAAFEARHLQVRAALDQLDAALAEAETRHDAEAVRRSILEALHEGAFILCPPACPRNGCAVALYEATGRDHIRVCYGAETGTLAEIGSAALAGLPCPHCGVQPGEWHHIGCVFEMCPLCGKALLTDCTDDYVFASRAPSDMAMAARETWRASRTRCLARIMAGHAPRLRRLRRETGVNLRPTVRALMEATRYSQMQTVLRSVSGAELSALRGFYRSLR